MKTKGFCVALMAQFVCLTAMAVEAEIGGLWYDLVSRAKEAKVIQYKNGIKYSGDVVIPETVEYEGVEYCVTNIGAGAFSDCYGLTSVTIGNSVMRIEHDTFSGCSHLTSVTIPGSVTSIGDKAFYNCI